MSMETVRYTRQGKVRRVFSSKEPYMRIVPLHEHCRGEWDNLVSVSNDAWLFHFYDWIKLEEAESTSVSFLIESDDGILGIFPLYLGRRSYAGIIPATLLHTGRGRAGPALAPGLNAKQQRAVYRQMLFYVDELAREHRVNRLEIRLPSLAPSYLPPLRPSINPLNFYGPFTPLRYGHALERVTLFSCFIRLDSSTDTLWKKLDEDCRNAVRKAKRNGVTIALANSEEEVEQYHLLQVEGFRRTGAKPNSLQHLQNLWRNFHPRGMAHILFAELHGERIAALLLLSFRECLSYWGGCSKQEYLKLRPNNFLIWQAICWAKESNHRWFELGPTFPHLDPESKARKVGRFKAQFGGESYYLFEGAKDYRPVKMALLDILDARAARWSKTRLIAPLRARGWLP
jgi:hypothetical protein